MKSNTPKKAAAKEYPAGSEGSKLAEEARKAAYGLSEEERAELFNRGMQVIYGGSGGKQAARAR